jgi:hypothetical protein
MSIENAWRVVDRALRDGEFAERLTRTPEQVVESLRRDFPGMGSEEAQATLQEAITALGVHYKLRTAAREEDTGRYGRCPTGSAKDSCRSSSKSRQDTAASC